MRSPISRERIRPAPGVLIPVAEVELYLLLGWRLLDEPECSFVRMLAPPTDYLEGRGR